METSRRKPFTIINTVEVQRIYCFWRICWHRQVYESKRSNCKETILHPVHRQPLPTTARGRRIGARRTLWRCGRRRSGLSAPLTAALLTILCGAFLNWGSEHSFTTKPRPWSQRSGSWCGLSPGTPWRRPARGSGPGPRISWLLMAVLLNESNLSMFLSLPTCF